MRFDFLLFCLLFSTFAFKGFAQSYTEHSAYIKANSNWIHDGFPVTDGDEGSFTVYRYDFNEDPPAITTLPFTFGTFYEGRTAVSDTATGELLFFTDGQSCYNNENEVMPNGSGLFGSNNSGQGAQIVPVIDSPGKFYLFTVVDYAVADMGENTSIYYSIIDMNLDDGKGDIVEGQKNILLDGDNFMEAMIAIPGNNCDIWLLTHTMSDTFFKAFQITKEGINPDPVVSSAGDMIYDPEYGHTFEGGSFSSSPDRTLVAVGSYNFNWCPVLGWSGSGGMMLTRFDATTGMFSDGILINDSIGGYSSCFSPDGTKLYIQGPYDPFGFPDSLQIIQYDVTDYFESSIIASKYIVAQFDNIFNNIIADMRRMNDTIITSHNLSYIAAPNLMGSSCNYQSASYFDEHTLKYDGLLGNDVVYPFPRDTTYHRYLDTNLCPNSTIVLFAPDTVFYSDFFWSTGSTEDSILVDVADSGLYWLLSSNGCHSRVDTFFIGDNRKDPHIDLGDDIIECEKGSMLLYPEEVDDQATLLWSDGTNGDYLAIDTSGLYWVTSFLDGCTDMDSIYVLFKDSELDLGEDIVLCDGDPVNYMLRVNVEDDVLVKWNNGMTAQEILVQDTGTYWVSVTDANCSYSDTIHITKEKCDCQCLIPNAFSPNQDGLNDIFLPTFEPDCIVADYQLSIFNRWGERVFVSFKPERGWDGKYNGQPSDTGIYMFELRYKGGTKMNEYYKKGDLLLIK